MYQGNLNKSSYNLDSFLVAVFELFNVQVKLYDFFLLVSEIATMKQLIEIDSREGHILKDSRLV